LSIIAGFTFSEIINHHVAWIIIKISMLVLIYLPDRQLSRRLDIIQIRGSNYGIMRLTNGELKGLAYD